MVLDHPQIAHVAAAISATSAVGAWVPSLDLWVRIVAGLVAIVAGIYSIRKNSR